MIGFLQLDYGVQLQIVAHLSFTERVRLANVSRAMQEWSAEHGDRLYGCVDLILYGESLVDPASWAKAKWLQRHIAHIIDVGLVMYESTAMQLLPIFAFPCLGSRVESLRLSSPADAGWYLPEGQEGWEPIEVAELSPLGALRQLRYLALSDLTDLGPSLISTLCHLTALTTLWLAVSADSTDETEQCEAFAAATAMTLLEELHVTGSSRTHVDRLPDGMARLTRLRELHVRNVRIKFTSHVLATLTALEALTILRDDKGRRSGPRLENPLPHGMHALCSLRQLWVTCYYQPMPALALPALEFMQLDAPLFGGEDDEWPWLAEDLPNLRTLMLSGVLSNSGLWPTAMAKCTGLKTVQLFGNTAEPIPGGPYLSQLRQLDWLCASSVAMPAALADATALEWLTLGLAPERVVQSSILDTLPSLRLVNFAARHHMYNPSHVNALLTLQERLRASVRRYIRD